MIKEKARILSQERLSDGVYDMTIQTAQIAKDAKPGQFVNVYLPDKSRILPRPISICGFDRDEGTLRIVYRVTGKGKGTDLLSGLKAGDNIEVLGPLGNGYDLSDVIGKKVLLLGGGIGIPPMLGLAKALCEITGERCEIALGYRDSDMFLENEFRAYGNVHISTDDGSYGVHGNAIDAASAAGVEPDIVMACGPGPMLKGVKAYTLSKGAAGYISLEERMACGVGACLACVCKTSGKDEHSHVNNARVCKEGPVFNINDVEL